MGLGGLVGCASTASTSSPTSAGRQTGFTDLNLPTKIAKTSLHAVIYCGLVFSPDRAALRKSVAVCNLRNAHQWDVQWLLSRAMSGVCEIRQSVQVTGECVRSLACLVGDRAN